MDERRIPVVLCVDCEPDERVWDLDNPSTWCGFEDMANRMARVRDRLERATGAPAHVSWMLRMDPQIGMSYGTTSFLPERFPAFFDAIDRNGDRSGIHPHAWRWEAKETTWIADYQNAAWVSTCVETAYESYREAFGRVPAFHRFGDAFMSTEVMNQVRAAGSAFDLTLEPGLHTALPLGPTTKAGALREFAVIPRVPYCPEPADYTRVAGHADDGFLAVPLSSGRYVPPRARPGSRLAHPTRTARGVVRRLRAPSLALRAPYRPLSMWRRWRSPADFWDSAFAAAEELERPYLAFAIRSDPITSERVDAIVDALGEDPRAVRLTFTTLDRVHGLLR